jgi:hypothetical protein
MEENNKKLKNSSDSQKPNSGSGSMPPLDLKLKNSDQNSAPEELMIKTESDNSQKVEPKEANSNLNNNNGIPNINTGSAQNNNNYQTGMPPQPNNNFNNGNLPPAPSKSHTGLIIGIIVGVLFLFVFIAGMIILAVTLSKNKTKVVTNNGSSNSSSMDSSNNEDTGYSSNDTKLDTSAPDYNKDYYYSFRTDASYYGPSWEVQGSTSDPGTRSFSNPATGCVATFKSTANDPKKSSYQAIEDSINEIKTFKEFSDVVIVDRDSNSVIIPKLGGGNIYLKSYQINFKQNGLPARARISAYATSKSILFATETCLDQNWSKGQLEFYDIEDKQEVLGY